MNTSLPTELINIIKRDQKKRLNYKDLKDSDLIELNIGNINKKWDYEYPTLYKENQYIFINEEIKNNIITKKDNNQHLNILQNINFDHIFVAGGCISNILFRQKINDIDIFLYDLSENDAKNKINEIIKITKNNYENYKKIYYNNSHNYYQQLFNDDNPEYIILNTPAAITIKLGEDIKIQIILRIYNNKSEILHGFDLGSAQIGYDGKEIYLTELSEYCYKYMINIIDTTRRSTTYEKRLQKYFKRGFKIVLPNLDIGKLSKELITKYIGVSEIFDNNYLQFLYSDITNNKIQLYKWIKTHKIIECTEIDYTFNLFNKDEILLHNLQTLIKNKDNFYYITNDIENYDTNINIDTFDNLFLNNIYDKNKIINNKTNEIDINYLKKYFNNHLIIDYVLSNINSFTIHNNINTLIDKQKKIIFDKINNLTFNNDVKFITENPGTQLSGSLNPIIDNPENWYGKYYKIHV